MSDGNKTYSGGWRVWTAPDLQMWGRVRHECEAEDLALTSFLFHFPLFSDVYE